MSSPDGLSDNASAVPPPAPDAPVEEHERHWIQHVYRQDVPQLTPRAIVAGMFLGGVMSLSNLYVGLKVGWSFGMAITSTILAFGLFKTLEKTRAVRGLSELENTTVASAGSAAGYFSSAGMVSAIPALYLLEQRQLSAWQIAIWMSLVSFLGVVIAIPMQRQLIRVERLKFPSGVAAAATIRAMHSGASSGAAQVLFIGMLVGALLEFPLQVGGLKGAIAGHSFDIRNALALTKDQILIPVLLFGAPLSAYTIGINISPLLYAGGGLMGLRAGLSLGVSALALYLVVAPWLASHGIVTISEGLTFRSVMSWSIWPAVTGALVATLFKLALGWRNFVRAFQSLTAIATSKRTPETAEFDKLKDELAKTEVPMTWFGSGLVLSSIAISIAALVMFDIPVYMTVIAIALSFGLAMVGCRAVGETDVNPIGPLGKITQLTFALLRPGHYATNLMTATVTAGAVSHAGDLLMDQKTGYILGASSRKLFIAQFFGIVAGAFFCAPAYAIIARPEKLGTAELPAPAAQSWAAVAELLGRGVSIADRGPANVRRAEIQVVALAPKPAGTKEGDSLIIESGAAAGSYRVLGTTRGGVVLDRDIAPSVAGAGASVVAQDGAQRGSTKLGAPQTKPAVEFVARPEVVRPADSLRVTINGTDVYHRIEALRGNLALIDHPFAGHKPTAYLAHVKRFALPPFALEATIIASLLGILFTLLEVYGSQRLKKYLPSFGAATIGWMIACNDSLAMMAGSIAAAIVVWQAPKWSEKSSIPTYSGLLAGASLFGIFVTLMRDILKVVYPPG